MNVSRIASVAARWLAIPACMNFAACSGMMTTFGGGPTAELRQAGVAATAEILEIWDTGWSINDNPVIGMRVLVRPPDRPDYEATIEKTTISRIAVPQFQPGNVLPVLFDPANPSVVEVDPDGGESAAAAPSSGNPFRDRYEAAAIVGASFLPAPPEPALYLGTADLSRDFQTLFEHEYALLGGSGTRDATDPAQALEQGREIGAALVVLYGSFAPLGGQELELLPFRRKSAGPFPASAVSERFVSGRIGPRDQFATYWGKTRPPILGIVSRPLDAREQASLRRSDGIVIETISIGSPAEAAGIAVGDVVVAIDGHRLDDPRAVPQLVTSLAGRTVQFDLLRDGSPLALAVALHPVAD